MVFSETGAAVLSYYILQYERAITKGTSDHLSVYAAEIVAILIASQWTEENNKSNVGFDSWAAPSSIKTGKSYRQDLLIKSYQLIHAFHNKDLMVDFVWVPAHIRVEGNEAVDILVKQSLKSQMLDIRIPFSSQTEDKSIIKSQMEK